LSQVSADLKAVIFLSLVYTYHTVAGQKWRWIDGSILIVSVNTIGFIFIDAIDPLVKDFLFLLDSINHWS
jgi:hypothetical protein